MTPTHTPGHWMIQAERNPADDGDDDIGPVTSAVLTRDAFVCGGIAIDADARLIAAAPDLLAALQALVDEYEPNLKAFALNAPRRAIWEDACAAIAQATGGAA